MSNLQRKAFLANLPDGCFWKPKKDGDLDKMYDTIGDILEIAETNLNELKYIRDPYKTPVLDDLEKEYGIAKNENLTEDERREQLALKVYNVVTSGAADKLEEYLQTLLDPSINVYQNDPAVDPNVFIAQGFIIINTGDGETCTTISQENWPFVFFIGGEATYGGSGEILTIKELVLSDLDIRRFRQQVIAYKPLYTWCAAVLVVGNKCYLSDANNDFIVDANGDNIYGICPWTEEGNWIDENGNNFVDENGDRFLFYF